MAERAVSLAELVDENQIEVGAGRPRSVNQDQGPLPILRVADVLDGKIGSLDFSSSPESHSRDLGPKVSRPGDIVLTVKGTVGRVALMPSQGPRFAYSPQLCYFRPRTYGPLAARYLYYWFRSADFWIQANALKGQTDMADFISLGDILSLKLRIPSRAQQENVVGVLGALDDKIAVNERIAVTAGQLADSIFGQHAQKARLEPMSKNMVPILGGTPDRKVDSYWGPGIPWASAKDVASATSGVVVETTEQITTEAAASTRVKPLPERSVVLTARGTVGAVARVTRPTAINQSCYAFIPGDIPPALLFHLIRTGAENMLGVAHGTVFSTVNMKTFDHVLIPAIDIEMRAALEEELAPLHRQIEARIEESRTLATLRDTLLPQLMSGKLRIRDAEKIVEDAV